MKKLFIALAVVFSLSTEASHLIGGELYWECDGSGNYVFSLVLYRDCNNTILTTLPQTINSNSPIGNITCNFFSEEDISIGCYDSLLYTGVCDEILSTPGAPYRYGSIIKYTYRSAPITITGITSVNGWNFHWSDCCRPASNQNTSLSGYHLNAMMYANDSSICKYESPRFVVDPVRLLAPNGSFSEQAITSSASDIISYKFTSPLSAASTPINWAAGYSYDAPFPDATESPLNGPVFMDSITGLITYDVQNIGTSATNGSFAYAVEASSSRNGIVRGKIRRDMVAWVKPDPGTNNPPAFVIDSLSASHTLSHPSMTTYMVDVFMGDTLKLKLLAQDFDFSPTGTPQTVSFDASGYYLDSTWMNSYPLASNLVSLNPIAPQSGFSSAINNSVFMEWAIPIGSTSSARVFNFKMADDACDIPAESKKTLVVNIKKAISINTASQSICLGDTAQLFGFSASGNYLWSPALEISNVSAVNPEVWPSSSRYYYLHDAANSLLVDSVYISVNGSLQSSLVIQSSGMLHTNGGLPHFIWKHNGIGFSYLLDTLSPFGTGTYWVTTLDNNCYYNSDTINHWKRKRKSTTDVAFSTVVDSLININGSIAIEFIPNDPLFPTLNGIRPLGLHSHAGLPAQLHLKIYETATQNLLWSKSVLRPFFGEFFEFDASLFLNNNTSYTLVIEGDQNLLIQPHLSPSYPMIPNSNFMTIKGVYRDTAGVFPSQPSLYLPSVVLRFGDNIGFKENALSQISFYPNPAKNNLIIEFNNNIAGGKINIEDLRGRHLMNLNLDKTTDTTIDVSHLPKGVYILSVLKDQNFWSVKFIKD